MRKVWQIFNVFENATGDSVVESYVTIAKQEAQKQAKEAGLRNTIGLDSTNFCHILNDFLAFQIGEFTIPTGLLLFMGLCCVLVWLFSRSKTGQTVSYVMYELFGRLSRNSFIVLALVMYEWGDNKKKKAK